MSTIERLDDGRMTDEYTSWIITALITTVAFVLRVWNVGFPNSLVFDETYYPKDAWTMLHQGYEGTWGDAKTINPQIAAGTSNGWTPDAEFVVHPPLGKELISIGEHLFGMTSFGWRFSSALFGTLMIVLTIRLARRLSRSTMVGAIAGILLTLDGLQFVMSRVGLLDIFQATFLVAGVAAVAADRDWFRHHLADEIRQRGQLSLAGQFGPRLWWRPWRLVAGIMLGAACAVKWNSMFVLATMGIVSVAWDVSARRLAGAGRAAWWSILKDGVPAFLYLVVVGAATYLASWGRWLSSYSTMTFGKGWGGPRADPGLAKVCLLYTSDAADE